MTWRNEQFNAFNSDLTVPSSPTLSPAQAAEAIKGATGTVRNDINALTRSVFRTRGGRMGSGMGLLLEGLWGYYTSAFLEPNGIEIAWLADDQYNDYACVAMNQEWDPVTREGELLRIEAKSMNMGADESKGHFAELAENIRADDLLAVFTWRWEPEKSGPGVWPHVLDIWVDRAAPIAELRDRLHIARGGSFVDRNNCPDDCDPAHCTHHGEPLNANGKRERLQGPASCKPANTQFAANFGGLVRMIAARGASAAKTLDDCRKNPIATDYIDFIKKNRGSTE